MMWANAAAESMFTAAPARPKSTPPPVSEPAPALPAEPIAPAPEPPTADRPAQEPQPGLFGRIRDTVLGWFGRRRVSHESA